jgi:hypothetical protein
VLVGEEDGTEVACRVYERWNVGEKVSDALDFLYCRPSTKHGGRVWMISSKAGQLDVYRPPINHQKSQERGGLTLQNSHPLLLGPSPFGHASCPVPLHAPFSIQITNILDAGPISGCILSNSLT